MNGAMFNSLARFVDQNFPAVSFSDLCRQVSLKTNVFAELTWYPEKDFLKVMEALSEMTETEIACLWRDFGRESFLYFMDTFHNYVNGIKSFADLLTNLNRIHHDLKKDGLGSPPLVEFIEASPDHFKIRYASPRHWNDFFMGMLEGAVRHFKTDMRILGTREKGKYIVTITTRKPEAVMV